VQAFSGLAAALRPDAPAAASLMTLTDLLGGMVCAEGVVAGLLARLRTGTGQRVDSSLLSAATTLLEPARPRPPRTILSEPLATADGYLVLSVPARRRPGAVGAALGVDQGREVAAALAGEVTSVAVERLRQAGLGAVAVCSDLSTLSGDPRFAGALQRGACTLPRAPWSFA
ncbi:MAG TPA: CoA transferase, partial [Solirubrobacteraceae bacterium]|nr:CoA transferase [Solirubrobacteraceae bacterium]